MAISNVMFLAVKDRFHGAFAVLALGVTGLLAGCDRQPTVDDGAAEYASADDRVFAVVGDQSITQADLERAIIATPRPQQLEYIDAGQRLALLEMLIDRKLLAARARAAGLQQQPDVAESLARAGADGFERERILAQALLDDLLAGDPVGDVEIQAYYRANADAYTQPERVRILRAILADMPSARQARAALRAGADAAGLANATADRGRAGELWLQRHAEPDPLARAAFELAAGETSEVIAVSGGYAVLRVEDREPARQRPLDEVRAGIVARLEQQRDQQDRSALLAELRANTAIEIDQAALSAYRWGD